MYLLLCALFHGLSCSRMDRFTSLTEGAKQSKFPYQFAPRTKERGRFPRVDKPTRDTVAHSQDIAKTSAQFCNASSYRHDGRKLAAAAGRTPSRIPLLVLPRSDCSPGAARWRACEHPKPKTTGGVGESGNHGVKRPSFCRNGGKKASRAGANIGSTQFGHVGRASAS